MFLFLRHVHGRSSRRCVVLPRDTGLTSERRYLQPPQKPLLPNVTFYGGPYYGYQVCPALHSYSYSEILFIQSIPINIEFGFPPKIRTDSTTWQPFCKQQRSLAARKNAMSKIFFAAIVNWAGPWGRPRPPPVPHTLIVGGHPPRRHRLCSRLAFLRMPRRNGREKASFVTLAICYISPRF